MARTFESFENCYQRYEHEDPQKSGKSLSTLYINFFFFFSLRSGIRFIEILVDGIIHSGAEDIKPPPKLPMRQFELWSLVRSPCPSSKDQNEIKPGSSPVVGRNRDDIGIA